MAGMDKNGNKKFQKSYFDVLGICCSSEVPLIEKILKSLDGVKDVSVIVPTKTVIVIHDDQLISHLQIVKALNQAKFEANVRARGDKNFQKKWPSPFTIACGVLLLLSFLKYLYPPLKWLAIAAVVIGIPKIILRGVSALRNFTLDVNVLVFIAVVGSIALQDYWEAGTIVFLFTIAEWLESRASHKATAVMSSLVNVVPQRAVLAETGEEVNADEVKLNTILAVKAGETIPIDGVVVEGNCEVDEKTLTGESFPVAKEKDSTVLAGTINLNGYISIKTTAVAEDCVVSRMAKLVEDAQNNKSKTQRFIDKCAKYYTPVVVAMSASFAIVPVALRVHNWQHWCRLAMVILVSACPCALILSTPVAMFCALSKAATSGLLFKGAEYLETLSKIKIMAFDKTGTITRGEFIVTDFRPLLDDVSLETLLYWVASIESKSSHPMASALVDYAQSHSVTPKPDKVEQFQNFPGEGISGKIEGKEIYVGNRKISLRVGCETVPTTEDDTSGGKSIGFVFMGSCLAGIFSLSDVCRTGVEDALKELKTMGIKTAMLTGDSYGAAKHAQNQLGGRLDVIHAELLPEDKARIIQDFQKEGPTAMIGDGLNDAPALAAADIGISMGVSGSALATETGNVILMSNDIKKIPKATHLARRVRRKIIENVILSISTKAAIVALALAGHPFVWAAVLADVGTCLLVIFNSMLILRGAHVSGRKCCKSSAPHIHKSKSKSPHCQSSHAHQACCPDTHKKHDLKTCSSDICDEKCLPLTSNSCGNNTCSTLVEKHGCHSHYHPLNKENDVDHESCNTVDEETGSCGGHDHGCLDQCHPNDESANSVQKHGSCAPDHEIHDTEHCNHMTHSHDTKHQITHSHDTGHCNHMTHSHDTKHQNPHSHDTKHQIPHSHSHDTEHCNPIPHSHDTEHCNHIPHSHDTEHCNHTTHSSTTRDNSTGQVNNSNCQEKCSNNHSKHKPSNQGVTPGCQKHSTECSVPIRSTINILRGNSHVNCSAVKTCSTLAKRQVSGCCRKQCCPKSARLGASFRGLPEIVIE